MPVALAAAVGGLAAVVVALAWVERQRRRRWRAAREALARGAGMEWSLRDPLGLATEPFRLFGFGSGGVVRNVCWVPGPRGWDVTAFDYQCWTDVATSPAGHVRRDAHRFVCAAVTLDPDGDPGWPRLRLDPVDWAAWRPVRRRSRHRVELEVDDLNRALRVWCPDARFAHVVADPRVTEQLLDAGVGVHHEVSGGRLLVAVPAPAADVTTAARLLEHARALRASLPAATWDLYGGVPC